MYEFVDIDELPISREMSIQTILNGVNLDYTVEGFTTLAVHGREIISRNIVTQDFKTISGGGKRQISRNYRDNSFSGNKYLGSALPSRSIKVEFLLKSSTNKNFREVCERLNYHLHNEQMTVQFTDDLDYQFFGTLSGAEDIDAISNSVIGSFELECADPFKYSVRDRIFNFETEGKFNFYTLYPAIFSKIEIELKGDANVFKLTNATTGESIILNDDFEIGDKIIINIEENTITKNGIDIFSKLALISDLETFGAIFNDELVTSIPSQAEIYFKERRL